MRSSSLIWLALAAVATSLELACQTSVAGGGSSSETTNGAVIAGWVLTPDSSAVQGARVVLRDQRFLQDTTGPLGKARTDASNTLGETLTDSTGFFFFDSVSAGTYRVSAMEQGVARGSTCELNQTGSDTIWAVVPPVTATGSIWGYVRMSDLPVRAWVRIYGVSRVTQSDASSGAFRFDGLPAGRYKVQAWRTPADTCTLSEHDSVYVYADSTYMVHELELCDD